MKYFFFLFEDFRYTFRALVNLKQPISFLLVRVRVFTGHRFRNMNRHQQFLAGADGAADLERETLFVIVSELHLVAL